MSRTRLGACAGLALALAAALSGARTAADGREALDARLSPDAIVATRLPRYGVNLGGWTTWGAEQLSAQLVKNPGLQPGIDRGLVVVGEADGDSISDDARWAARPPGSWEAARFTVLTGDARGATGVVRDPAGAVLPGAQPALGLSPAPRGLARGDVIALTRDAPGTLPFWWLSGAVRARAGAGPDGVPAAELDGMRGPAALRQYFDMLGPRAGKLLPLDRRWRLRFQVRATHGAPVLRARFGRDRAAALIERTIAPSAAWQSVRVDVDGADAGPAGPVTLSFEARDGALELADIALEDREPGAGGFRRAVVDTLKALRPGYLRDWQGQLGDTAANRFAAPRERRPTRYRAGDAEWQYGYGIDDLFELSAAVGARPWLVLPTTLDDAEAVEAGRRIGQLARRHGIDETVIEFGNENWNALFRPAGILNQDTLAERSDRVFALLRAAARPSTVHLVVGAQYANPTAVARLGARAREADGVAVAPYFLYRMAASQDGDGALDLALDLALDDELGRLASLAARLRGSGKQFDVYEVNFHTTLGDAPATARAALLDRPGAGAALAAHLVAATLAGSRRQAVYSLAGFDTRLDLASVSARDGFVPLWGVTRDLAGPAHWRPTGAALALLNEVAGGTVRATRCDGSGCGSLLAALFDDARFAVVSRSAEPLRVALPCAGHARLRVRWLDDSAPTPEGAPREAALACVDGATNAVVPPRGLLVARPDGSARSGR